MVGLGGGVSVLKRGCSPGVCSPDTRSKEATAGLCTSSGNLEHVGLIRVVIRTQEPDEHPKEGPGLCRDLGIMMLRAPTLASMVTGEKGRSG